MVNGIFLLFALPLFNTIGIQDFQLTSPHAVYNCIGVIPAGGGWWKSFSRRLSRAVPINMKLDTCRPTPYHVVPQHCILVT